MRIRPLTAADWAWVAEIYRGKHSSPVQLVAFATQTDRFAVGLGDKNAVAGFRQVGVREWIGEHHGIWRDVLLFERRS